VPGALVLVALLVVTGLIKPALKAAATTTVVGGQLDAMVSDPSVSTPANPTLALSAPQSDRSVTDARALAKQNPAAVAHIVRDWVNES
jgi:flagellar M-ring protein FliF